MADYEPGNYVKLPENVFMKIIDKNNGLLDLEPTNDDVLDSKEPMTVRPDDCEKCLSPHEFGQVKRFAPNGGTGFSKQGRKLKHPRHHLLKDESSSLIKKFLNGKVEAKELIEC